MPLKNRLDHLGALAARLPFPLEDFAAVDRTFCRWVERREDDDLEVLEIWLYCYVQRYVLARILRLPLLGGGEADRIIDRVFKRARDFERVDDPACFTHWLSVVCRNAFLNSLRRRYQPAALDLDALAETEAAPEASLDEVDRAHIRYALTRAIGALPESLQSVARMRLLEDQPYRHIADATGLPLPTVRAYAAKALRRLRNDPGLRALTESLDLVPP